MYICARVQGPPGGRGFPPPRGPRPYIIHIYRHIYINMNLHADNCSIFIYTCIYHAYIYITHNV